MRERAAGLADRLPLLRPGAIQHAALLAAEELFIGILVDNGSHHNKIFNNHLRKTTGEGATTGLRTPARSASRCTATTTRSPGTTISGSDTCSRFYGRDGTAVEVYGGQRNRSTTTRRSTTTTSPSSGNNAQPDNTYAYNVVCRRCDGDFLVTRGAGDALRARLRDQGLQQLRLPDRRAALRDPVHQGLQPRPQPAQQHLSRSDRIGYADAAFDEGNNSTGSRAARRKVYFPISSTSRRVDPRWLNAGGRDFKLGAGSPAIDLGSMVAYNMGFRTDLQRNAVPRGAAPDAGAYER